MRVYFEDGKLRDGEDRRLNCAFVIDAGDGYSHNNRELDRIRVNFGQTNYGVYTNSLVAISNTYCWDEKNNRPNIYFRSPKTGEFVHVYELTDKEIRFAHNLLAMYRSHALGV